MSALEITEPGVYEIDAATYHRDPVPGGSLSSTGAKKLVPPSCPAKFRQWLDDGEPPPRQVLDLGKAAHAAVLGVGDPVRVIDAPDYKRKVAAQEREDAYAAGETPILAHEHGQITDMVAALRDHPVAGPLLDPTRGVAERALFWRDEEFGIWRRALLDFHTRLDDGRFVIVDYKTTRSAEPSAVERSVGEFGYYMQDPWYCDGAAAVGLDPRPEFLFVFQEKTPPYVITIGQLTTITRGWGRLENRRAMRRYRECTRTGRWPGYVDDVEPLDLPQWQLRQKDAAFDRGDYTIIPKGSLV